MKRASADTTNRMIRAGMLAWLLPGAGHYVLGQRGLAAVIFVAISLPYLTGVAIGGVKESVNPKDNPWLFVAEMWVGGYSVVGFAGSAALPAVDLSKARNVEYVSFYPESDVAQIYLATAGLLNILAILDALTRAQTGGQPVFAREALVQTEARAGGGP